MDLERRRPNLYGQHQQVDVSVDIGSALQEIAARMRADVPAVVDAGIVVEGESQ
jgi:hypothetical protein